MTLFPYQRQGCSAQWVSQARADPHRGEALEHMTVNFLKFVIVYNKENQPKTFPSVLHHNSLITTPTKTCDRALEKSSPSVARYADKLRQTI